MQLDIFTICDAATFDGHKLNILGTFDMIVASTLPCIHDSFSVASRVRFTLEDGKHHTLGLHCVDEDGKIIDSSEPATFELLFERNFTDTYSLIWNIRHREFLATAEYHFELRVDDKILAEIPFYICSQTT